ncbi:MAG: hypothetical protein COX70_01800 [Flavobacteriales bacterium CG_4_10_14_0_2_um_filter_32_8]|nr:MAG: hypothetical protein COX70_01800 [Flavobacteriales bacterium CG_4_10_14_0_2_um_filter_32_8]
MESIEGNKLIVKMQLDLAKKGINKDVIVKGLQELRPYALEEKDPTLTKVIRLAYEHIENNGTFNIPIPADEEIDDDLGDDDHEEVPLLIVNTIETDKDRVESLNYLLSLMLDRTNASNREELFIYRDALKEY